jgi:phosphoglucomutase
VEAAALERAVTGFAGVAVAPEIRDAALTNLRRWLSEDAFVAYRPQIEALIERRAWDVLLDAFWQVIPFGTGGRRGPCGIGPNRINPWTIATSVQGHVEYLHERYPDAPLRVVIAYDVRVYRDRSGSYDPARPNPVLGLSSRDYAELAARVYTANGVEVVLQRRGDPHYLSTPELSYAIRHLKAHAGLNVSASHNPPDDNGGKFYNALGGQEIPPDDEAMVRKVEAVETVRCLSWQKAKDSGFLRPYADDVHAGYVAHIAGRSLAASRSAKVVFTALHGTGGGSLLEVLRNVGFAVAPVPEQADPNGDFPTVPFRAPNPEVPASMDLAVAQAGRQGADLVLATDPDADRIGAVIRHGGGWRFLTGNEIGTLVAHHALVHGKYPGTPLIVQTEVTSGFIPRMARALGANVVDHLLVGFKYVGEVLRQVEETGRYGAIQASLADFSVGIEESHGVLITPYLRDKDAAGGGLYLAEAASLAKDQGKTLVDVLEGLWKDHGYVRNHLVSTVMRGAVGRGRIQAIQDSFRATPPKSIAGYAVSAFHDRRDPAGPFGRITSLTDAASRDVLVFALANPDGSALGRVILRPSGTEPKNKAYVEVVGDRGVADLVAERARVDALAARIAEGFVDEMLSRVGLAFPAWAHGISDLVPVEGKVAFAKEILPELVARLGDGRPVDPWLDGALAALGKDPRRLVSGAIARYVAAKGEKADDVARLFSAG